MVWSVQKISTGRGNGRLGIWSWGKMPNEGYQMVEKIENASQHGGELGIGNLKSGPLTRHGGSIWKRQLESTTWWIGDKFEKWND